MNKQEFDSLIEMTTDQQCYEKIEYVYTYCPFFSNTNGKQEIADFYRQYDMNGIERLYKETLEIQNMENNIEELKKEIEQKDLETMKLKAFLFDFLVHNNKIGCS